MSQKTFTLDARIPISKDISKDDPNHPKNVSRNFAILTNQAAADTKYDIIPPPRKNPDEGFANPMSDFWKLVSCVIIILLALLAVVSLRSMYVKISSIALLLLTIHYATYILENRIV